MKLIISGSRTYNNYNAIKKYLDSYLKNITEEIEIVSGAHWEGVDLLGEQYAKENNHSLKRCPADWKKYGKPAGPIRNREMDEYSTHCICFWDGKSRGTKDMYDIAMEKGLITKLIMV